MQLAQPPDRFTGLRMTGRHVNLLLEVLLVLALVSGLVSWVVPLSAARPVVVIHAAVGLMILVVSPLKLRGPVRTGFKRRRPTRWLSAAFGVMVLATVTLGALHATAVWFGVGHWSSLWTHQLIGFLLVPLLIWHVVSRPVRPAATDIDRRALLATGATGMAALGAIAVQESVAVLLGTAAADRNGTGSHETGSFDPDAMPTVQWIDDRAPADTSPAAWNLTVAGVTVPIADLAARSQPLVARLDCTGGWYADQIWDVVAVSDVLSELVSDLVPGSGRARMAGRSIRVTSSTGYQRLFPLADAAELFLAVGYDNRPLRRGHGAPVRLVAPNRRGPQWVKWVVDVDVVDRPAWLQLPLPPT